MTIGINLAMMLPAQSWAPTLDYNLSPNLLAAAAASADSTQLAPVHRIETDPKVQAMA